MTSSYFNPVKLVHGPDALAQVPELLAGIGVTRPLLVTDTTIAAAPFSRPPGSGSRRRKFPMAYSTVA